MTEQWLLSTVQRRSSGQGWKLHWPGWPCLVSDSYRSIIQFGKVMSALLRWGVCHNILLAFSTVSVTIYKLSLVDLYLYCTYTLPLTHVKELCWWVVYSLNKTFNLRASTEDTEVWLAILEWQIFLSTFSDKVEGLEFQSLFLYIGMENKTSYFLYH